MDTNTFNFFYSFITPYSQARSLHSLQNLHNYRNTLRNRLSSADQ